MAMTPQQARARALQLRSLKPELRNMAVDDLIAQVMATEGMGAPGAGGGALADIFQLPKTLTAASPAPMMAARLAAPKPTADIVPGAGTDSFRRAQQVRERTDREPAPEERAAANANRQALVEEVRAGTGQRAPEVAAATVREAAPVAAAAPEAAPKARAVQASRYRPMLEQAETELRQLDAQQQAIAAQGGTASPELVSKFENLSGKVSQLKLMVAAEEGAAVSAERTAVLERQTQRLSREKELVEQARKRAPFDALIAAGTALGSARPGESFTSALTRGLAAGSQSYTGARDTRETSLRGIEERRDALILQNEDAIEKARADAIALAKTGVEMDAQQLALTKLGRDDVKALATQKADIDLAVAKASSAQTEAKYAPQVFEAEIDAQRALAEDRRRPPVSSSSSNGEKPPSLNQDRLSMNSLQKQVKEAFAAGDTFAKNKNFAEAERKFNEVGAAMAAYNIIAARRGLPSIGKPGSSKYFNEYVNKYGFPSKQGKKTGTGGQSRPAGVGSDWKLETDKNGNRAWVNPSRTKYVEI
jgi:hypothetical protein